jgi:flagellin
MRISTNVQALNARTQLTKADQGLQKQSERLASGKRINRAADDAAGLAISERLRGQIRSIAQAKRNANDGISLVQNAEGGLNEIGQILIRMRELSIQSASDSLPTAERQYLQKEVDALKLEIDRIALTTTWGKTKLLDGQTERFSFQVGVFNKDDEDRIEFDGRENNATLVGLNIDDIQLATKAGAQRMIGLVDKAQDKNNEMRANLGAIQNRLMSTVNNLSVSEENLSAAKSRIADTDVAHAASETAKQKILMNSAMATFTQAGSAPRQALKLIS